MYSIPSDVSSNIHLVLSSVLIVLCILLLVLFLSSHTPVHSVLVIYGVVIAIFSVVR